MSYHRSSLASSSDLDALKRNLDLELEKIEAALSDVRRLPTLHVEPAKPRNGDIVVADGSDWDPGMGAGLYTFINGEWVKSQEGGDYQDSSENLDQIAELEVDDYGLSLLELSSATALFDSVKQPATTSYAGVVEKATTGEVYAATVDKYLAADHLLDASAPVALTYASTFSWNWLDFINGVMTLTGDLQIGNPTNEIVGQDRTITVKGNNSTGRTLTFASEFGGEDPGIADITSTKWYDITIRCIAVSHFVVVAAIDVSPP